MVFLEKVAAARATLRGLGLGKHSCSSSNKPGSGSLIARALNGEEIQALKASGNFSSDPSWSNVKVVGSDSKLASSSIRNCTFDGEVYLGDFSQRVNVFVDDKIALPCGLYNSYIRDCVIMDNVRVSGCELLDSTYIESRAAVVGCGIITCSGNTTFGNGLELPIIVEVGGREIELFADLNFEEASKVIAFRGNKCLQQNYRDKVKRYVESAKSQFNIICSNAKISSVAFMSDAFIGEFATIRASQIVRSTIMSSQTEKSLVLSGSDVRDAILQSGCSVDSASIVEASLMCSHSHVEKHGKLLRSILGPLSSVAEGEVSSSFVGPLVGFHHQAGLIACYWPSGRGNIGFGANVGSNHTGKAPDQELWAGEGVFFGLGCCIKYPCDLTHSPYSMVASGIVTLPQRVEFPFSLINGPQQLVNESISPAINSISPGWVLSNSLFTVYRNEYKFRARAEKFPGANIEYRTFRHSTVALMQTAKKRLENASTVMVDSSGKPIYTEKHVQGLGKNFLTEAARVSAISIYNFFIEFYALQGLWINIEALPRADIVDLIYCIRNVSSPLEVELGSYFDYSFAGISHEGSDETECFQWEHQKVILADMMAAKNDIDDELLLVEFLIQKLQNSAEKIPMMVEACKSRDDVRGRTIIHGYEEAHELASEVSVTLRVSQEMSLLRSNTESFLNNLKV
eukprot:CAMPEP_0204828700 /NCGR_PEP_ID=MMETSP1346-20131115/6604_1 /ASSEMBLY_ACC=CAM_ASM_000771 /TAXON_ID=215587 /ORGANISM="Aplanochytrium stocchinoi, Strain GSBS06" /LENGTH=684 /DNA_ID=CAMNT_0051957979 /DNA_START=147 /DNA_END=2201 /DNA_ORIENTATION=-